MNVSLYSTALHSTATESNSEPFYVFKQFYAKLVKTLPMDDSIFIVELYSSGLLPDKLRHQIQLKCTSTDKAMCFLDGKIKPDISKGDFTSFNKLLNVMEECESDSVKILAADIKTTLKLEVAVNTDNAAGWYNIHTVYDWTSV